jgi:murein DD-endopeptidase MepM/ murein hydrolase activator NlpD
VARSVLLSLIAVASLLAVAQPAGTSESARLPAPPVGAFAPPPDGLLAIAPTRAGPAPRLRRPAELVAPRVSRRLTRPLRATPSLRETGYVFPVLGGSLVADTFGAPRADVLFHHGDDIFAAEGTPLLAVATGIVFSVGPNPIGGLRLWLRDEQGNEFYYAHLEAFSPLAVDGARVETGDVLGYVGNTGDAERTPPHLHFEVHPARFLGLGYDGAVDPTGYLRSWKVERALPPGELALRRPRATQETGEPGAFLLASTDISVASGLDRAGLERAFVSSR